MSDVSGRDEVRRGEGLFRACFGLVARASVGAFSGAVLAILGLSFPPAFQAIPFSWQRWLEEPRNVLKVCGVGAAVMATVAAILGRMPIRGRLGLTIQGIVLGGLIGWLLGSLLGLGAGKFGAGVGMVFGLPTGMLIGGILGWEWRGQSPGRDPS